jgi:thiol-disulfide isomerase/thioredoxin
VNFWATWCPPCRGEIPGFVNLQNEYADRDFVILGISMDQGDASGVKEFAKNNKMNYPVLFANNQVSLDYGGIRAIPTSFLVNSDGKIIWKGVGGIDEKELARVIEPYLPKKGSSAKKTTPKENQMNKETKKTETEKKDPPEPARKRLYLVD